MNEIARTDRVRRAALAAMLLCASCSTDGGATDAANGGTDIGTNGDATALCSPAEGTASAASVGCLTPRCSLSDSTPCHEATSRCQRCSGFVQILR